MQNSNFYNPFSEFHPMDFSLWAHPKDVTQERVNSPLAPTPTNGAPPAPMAPQQASIGGISVPAPTTPPLPPQPSAGEQSFAGRVHDKIQNHLVGDTPQGYDGFLTPQEIQAAKPSLSQSMFSTGDAISGGDRWTRNLNELVARKQAAAGAQQMQSAQIAQQRMLAATSKIFNDNPPPKTGTAADYAKWANTVHPQLVAVGNYGAAKELAPIVEEDAKAQAAAAAKPLQTEWEDTGGEKILTNKNTGAIIARVKKTPAPKDASAISADQKNSQDQTNKILDDYARDTKDFHQVMGGWDVLKGATKNPSLATPFAVTDAYARITNPGAIVRPTTMEMIDNMGSIGQRMRKFWDHNANGALPPDILKDFSTTLYNIVREHKNQFDQIRSQAVLRGSRSGVNDISSLLQNYQVDDPNAPPVLNKYKIDPVRK